MPRAASEPKRNPADSNSVSGLANPSSALSVACRTWPSSSANISCSPESSSPSGKAWYSSPCRTSPRQTTMPANDTATPAYIGTMPAVWGVGQRSSEHITAIHTALMIRSSWYAALTTVSALRRVVCVPSLAEPCARAWNASDASARSTTAPAGSSTQVPPAL